MKVHSEVSHTFRTKLPVKIVTNMYKYTHIHLNTRTYSKVDFKKLFSQVYSEFSHTSTIKIFEKIVNIFEYNDVVSRDASKRFACRIYEVC